jgi:hypothetical protein
MAMPFLSGKPLQDALKLRGEAPEEAWIRALLSPLMDALAVLHADKVYHRDIAPDNIMLLAGERPMLLDFGAARRVISDMTHALTVILKPGFAPIEQYADMPGMKQGPWTDVYALAAVVYFMILKRKPPPAVSRMMQDSYEPLMQSEAAGRYSARLLQGIDRCLKVRAEDRPQSMAAMREAIDIPLPRSADRPRDPARNTKLPLVVGGVLALVALAGGYAYHTKRPAPVAPAATTTVAVTAAAPATPMVKTPAASEVATPTSGPVPPVASLTVPVATPTSAPVPRIASLTAAIDAALAAADPRLSMTLEAPASVALGNELKLSIRSKSDGLLYLFAWDQAMDKIYRLMADEKDGGTAIKANGSFTSTHKDPASRAAQEPPGNWLVISMLSEKPRDFSTAAFGRDGDLVVVERSALERQLAVNGLSSLLGTAQCTMGESCQDHFAISVANIAKEAAPPSPVAKRAPDRKTASQNAPGNARPGKKAPDSEREYMKRLNKDLDNLLGK